MKATTNGTVMVRRTYALVTSVTPARIDDKARGAEKARRQSDEGCTARRKRTRGSRGRGSKTRDQMRRRARVQGVQIARKSKRTGG